MCVSLFLFPDTHTHTHTHRHTLSLSLSYQDAYDEQPGSEAESEAKIVPTSRQFIASYLCMWAVCVRVRVCVCVRACVREVCECEGGVCEGGVCVVVRVSVKRVCACVRRQILRKS